LRCIGESKNMQTSAEWLRENDPKWNRAKRRLHGDADVKKRCRNPREVKADVPKGRLETIEAFVRRNRSATTDECIFVPLAVAGNPARVKYMGRTIPAARLMALFAMGTPKHEKAQARHMCGNGHLSCVNPRHLVWGDASDNMSDAVLHRAFDKNDTAGKINAVTRF
jgi:hypothetical protein